MKIQLYDDQYGQIRDTHTFFDELRCLYTLPDMSTEGRTLIDMILTGHYLDLEYTSRSTGNDTLHRLTFKSPSKMTVHLSMRKINRFIKNFNDIASVIVQDRL